MDERMRLRQFSGEAPSKQASKRATIRNTPQFKKKTPFICLFILFALYTSTRPALLPSLYSFLLKQSQTEQTPAQVLCNKRSPIGWFMWALEIKPPPPPRLQPPPFLPSFLPSFFPSFFLSLLPSPRFHR